MISFLGYFKVSTERLTPHRSCPSQQNGDGIAKFMEHVEKIVADGLRHGFFDASITCTIVNGRKRELVIRGAKSFKFIVPRGRVATVSNSLKSDDPCDWDVNLTTSMLTSSVGFRD